MTTFLLMLFAGVCLFLLGWGMRKPGRICEFPFLVGATFAGFVLPQAVGLVWSDWSPPPGINAALLMSILCAVMCYYGYVVSSTPMTFMCWEFDNRRLLIVSAALSAIGAVFFALINTLPDEMVSQEAGGWTGLPVAYVFFAQLFRYGFAMALLLYARMQSKLALAIVLFGCVIQFEWIVVRGRRGFALEFFLLILCTFWFVWRKTLPRWAMLVMLVLGSLATGAAGVYRATVFQDKAQVNIGDEVPWEDVAKIDFLDVFLKYNQEESYEFQNCTYCIHTTDSFDGGLSFWNELVYAYVPAQVLGSEFKSSLRFDLPGEVAHPSSPRGTTSTGMADSFQAFGWFGCLTFFLYGFCMRKLFETAQAGHFALQLIYMVFITSALHTITHHTKWFMTPWIHMGVFLVPCLLWARKRSGTNQMPA